MREYYAHSSGNNGDRTEWQPLEAHLRQTALLARDFASVFGSGEWGYLAGLLHDLGKAADEFQAYLLRENGLDDTEYDCQGTGRVNHSSAGAAFAEECHNHESRPFGRILAYLIAGHHAGLADYYACDGGLGSLQKRLEEGRANLDRIRQRAKALVGTQCQLSKLPAFVKKDNFHFWARMLFSCLVDADFLDTEISMRPNQATNRSVGTSLKSLKEALDCHMSDIVAHCDNTLVNRARREILEACRISARMEPGLFALTVPTGGGKTLSAMTFALDHAILNRKRRIIYVIPYTSIIEQTATILAGIFGMEHVVEHHSNLDPYTETPRTRLASENWDASIIVTTNVQFFESLYAARPSRCRKLHNLANSVVILDEAQLVPPKLLSPCVAVINELTRNYGVTLVLSTATQPTLPNLSQPTQIIPQDLDLYGRLRRTDIHFPPIIEECVSWERLATQLRKHDQVLCIVNSRRDCYDLFKLMPEGTIHLSALMCGEHRSKIIHAIKNRLDSGEPIRVISTQLVEAGVDIDFPVVYRALAGLDSITQAAGRCNREGKLDQKGQVFVFVPPKPSRPGLLSKGESTTKELCALPEFDPQAQQSLSLYFGLFYSRVNDTGGGFLKILTPSDPKLLDVAFRTVGDTFRLIDNQDQRPVFVRYGKGQHLLRELQATGPRRILMRRLQRFTVNLSAQLAERMKSDGLLEEVWPGFLAQCSLSIYSASTGLDVFRDGFPVEDLTGV